MMQHCAMRSCGADSMRPVAGRALKRGLSGLGVSHRSDGLESMQSIEDALNEEEALRQM